MNVNKIVKILTASSAVFFIVLMVRPVKAEFIFLKDGSIIDGAIVSDTAASVTVRARDKKVSSIPRSNIMRILYTELKMAKIYIQKRDGEGLAAYMVDEDRVSYTFRKDLYKPDEFVLNRGDVLFIAEKNPSGLKATGAPGTDRVSLAWLPPYDDVKKYNVYITKEKSGKYILAESTGGKSVTLKNLSSNTTYYIVVTSVDSGDYESSPSNELKITTKNIPPERPVIISSGDIKSDERKIAWNTPADIDGKVEKYIIYGTIDGKREIIAETSKTEYNLKKALSYSKVEIAAVDNMGDESDPERVPLAGNTFLRFSPGIIIPAGKFGKMFNPGYGGMIALSERDLFWKDSEWGMALGFYYLQGKDLLDEKNKDYTNMMILPLYLTAGYNIRTGDSFILKPVLSLGGVYINMNYIDRNRPVSAGRDLEIQIFEPAFKAGLSAEYIFTDSLSFSAGCDFGGIRQNSGLLTYAGINASIGYSF